AVRSNEADDLAGVDIERDLAHRLHAAKAARDRLGPQQRRARGRPGRASRRRMLLDHHTSSGESARFCNGAERGVNLVVERSTLESKAAGRRAGRQTSKARGTMD